MSHPSKYAHTVRWQGLELLVAPSEGRIGALRVKRATVVSREVFEGFLDVNEHLVPADDDLGAWCEAHYIFDIANLYEECEQQRKAQE